MKVIKLYDKLGVNIIEKRNEFRFKDIKNLIDACGDEDVELDLRYIDIQEKGSEFSDIITDKRVHFVVYNEELYEYIKFIATVSGENPKDKVRLVENKITVEIVRPDESDRYYNAFKKALEESTDNTIVVGNLFSIVGSFYIIKGLVRVLRENKDKEVVVDINNVSLADNQVKELAEEVYKLVEDGYKVNVLTNNDKLRVIIESIITTCGSGVNTSKDKYELLRNEFKIGTAGVLSTFSSKADNRDPLGRGNNGVPVSSLPAILVGFTDEYAEFITYKYATFQTHRDYREEHDGEDHPGLKAEKKKVKLDDLGICAYCIGKRYHFNLPIQFDKVGLQKIYDYDFIAGTMVVKYIPLASQMMRVFNDWGIEYDNESLMDSIKISKMNLDKAGVKYSR